MCNEAKSLELRQEESLDVWIILELYTRTLYIKPMITD